MGSDQTKRREDAISVDKSVELRTEANREGCSLPMWGPTVQTSGVHRAPKDLSSRAFIGFA